MEELYRKRVSGELHGGAADLPQIPRPDHSPMTVKWEVRPERELLGLAPTDRVRPLSELSEASEVPDSGRVNARGRVWHRNAKGYRSEESGSVKLAGECGSLRIDVADEDQFEQFTDDAGVTLAGLHVEQEGALLRYTVDEETRVLAWNKQSQQRHSLMELAQSDGWPVSKQVDASVTDIRVALAHQKAELESQLEKYGETLSISTRTESASLHRSQCMLNLSFNQLLLPHDILTVYRAVAGVGGINWVSDSRRGTYLRGIRYVQ